MKLSKVIAQLEELLQLHGDAIVECRNNAGDFSDIDEVKTDSLFQSGDRHVYIDS